VRLLPPPADDTFAPLTRQVHYYPYRCFVYPELYCCVHGLMVRRCEGQWRRGEMVRLA